MAMKGAGYYSKATTGARDVINLAAPLIIDAIDRMGLADDGTRLRVADMGCADGGTSMEMWREVLRPSAPRAAEPADRDRLHRSAAQRFQPALPHDPQPDGHRELLRRARRGLSLRLGHLLPSEDLPAARASTSPSRRPPRITSPRCPATSRDHVHMVGAKGQERARL